MLIGQCAAAERIRILPADLSDEEQRGHAAVPCRVDILINNAATIALLGVTAAIPAAELRRAFEVNVATAALTAAVLPGMAWAGASSSSARRAAGTGSDR
jgi:short-subunit dehydrogenase